MDVALLVDNGLQSFHLRPFTWLERLFQQMCSIQVLKNYLSCTPKVKAQNGALCTTRSGEGCKTYLNGYSEPGL